MTYSGLFGTQFRVSRDLFTDITAGEATVRTFLPRLLTAASRNQHCTYGKIITYQTPHSNLPIAKIDGRICLNDVNIDKQAVNTVTNILRALQKRAASITSFSFQNSPDEPNPRGR